jgi:hypothetical protein
MKSAIKIVSVLALISLASCMGQQNKFPSEPVRAENTRIYGNIGGEPLQLKNKYADDDGKVAERATKIREKLFPR